MQYPTKSRDEIINRSSGSNGRRIIAVHSTWKAVVKFQLPTGYLKADGDAHPSRIRPAEEGSPRAGTLMTRLATVLSEMSIATFRVCDIVYRPRTSRKCVVGNP
jgi:hypothetical protein